MLSKEEMCWLLIPNYPSFEKLTTLDPTVYGTIYNIVVETISQYLASILRYIQACESPIEQLLALEMYRHFPVPVNHCLSESDYSYMVNPQSSVNIGPATYRVDFEVIFISTKYGVSAKLAIECDGHDFHEKTKAQAKRDKKRDRDLQRVGFDGVMHFTGSEIWSDAGRCAEEVWEMGIAKLEAKIK